MRPLNAMLRLMMALGVLLWLSASLGCVKEQPAVELTTAELITYTSEGDVLRVTIDETATRIRGVFRQSSTALRKYGSRHFNAPYEAEYLEQLEGVFTKFGVKYEVVK